MQAVLKDRLRLGRARVRAAKFRENGITLDGKRVYTIDRVHAGQILKIAVGDTDEALSASSVLPVPGPLDIVFEDDDLIVLNKPAGISTHPGPKHVNDTLGNYLMHYFQSTGQRCLLHPVQRLDWGTSGLIVFAKNAHAQQFLQKRLHTGNFCRRYIAFCQGAFGSEEALAVGGGTVDGAPYGWAGVVDAPIGCVGHTWQTAAVREGGKPARTHYWVQGQARINGMDVSKVLLQLETGRTHQIRIHMSYIGHPLLGDPDHGGVTYVGDSAYGIATCANDSFTIDHPALHSAFLQVEHPVSGKIMTFEAFLPPDLALLDVCFCTRPCS